MNTDSIDSISSSSESPRESVGSPMSTTSDSWHGHVVGLEEVSKSLETSLNNIKQETLKEKDISDLKENLQHLEISLSTSIKNNNLRKEKDKIEKISAQLKEITKVSQDKKIDLKKELGSSEKMISDSLKKLHAAKVIQKALKKNVAVKQLLKDPQVTSLPEPKFRRWIKVASPHLEKKSHIPPKLKKTNIQKK